MSDLANSYLEWKAMEYIGSAVLGGLLIVGYIVYAIVQSFRGKK